MKKLHFLLSLLVKTSLLLILANTAWAEVTAKIDRSNISINETFTLTVTSDKASLFNSPDLNGLNKHFDVLSQRKQSSHQFVNGKSSSSAQWIYTLAPKTTGNIVIPPIELDGEKTAALVIAVAKSAQNTNEGSSSGNSQDPVYTQTHLASDTSYVHSQNILTIKLFTSITISDVTIEELDIEDTVVKPLGNTSYRTNIGGKEHIVYEVKYALFPETSGELMIPSLTITASKGQRRSLFSDPYGSQGKIRLRTDSKTLMVEEIPDEFDGNLWIAAKDITLNEVFEGNNIANSDADTLTLKVGESITRIISIQADGLAAEQLPPLELPDINGIKFYPDQAEVNSSESLDGILGIREESYALIPTQAGTYTLPEVKLEWWNTQTNRMQTATLAAKTIQVTPAAGQQNTLPSSNNRPNSLQPNNSQGIDYSNSNQQPQVSTHPVQLEAPSPNPFWMYATGFFFILWVISTLLYWQLRKQLDQKDESVVTIQSNTELEAFKALQKQCKKGELSDVKTALIQWGKTYWPDRKVHSLADLKIILPELNQDLAQLDKALYQPGSNIVDKESLLNSLLQNIQSIRDKKQAQSKQALSALYPDKAE